MLDSLMGQLHTEVKRETGDRATVEVKREAYTAKGYTGDWREVLQENKSTKRCGTRPCLHVHDMWLFMQPEALEVTETPWCALPAARSRAA